MAIIEESKWKKVIIPFLRSKRELQFHVSPEIPKKTFSNCIKSYAKYVTSRGDRILALYDGGRAGKEGFALTEHGISYRDAYGSFGGCPYEHIISFEDQKGGDPRTPFPIVAIQTKDGGLFKISFMENPGAAVLLTAVLSLVVKENSASPQSSQPISGETLDEQWSRLVAEQLPHVPLEGLYKSPYLPDALVHSAISHYGKEEVELPEEVLALFEYKTSATEGFMMTARSFIYNMGYENWGSLRLAAITDVECKTRQILNNDIPSLVIKSSDGRTIELQFIIHPVVASYLLSILEKGVLLNRTHPEKGGAGKPAGAGGIDFYHLPHDPANRIYKNPAIPGTLADKVKESFPEAFSAAGAELMAVYDNSPGGTGESGCVLTAEALYLKNEGKIAEKIPYEGITRFSVDSGRHHSDILMATAGDRTLRLSFYLYKRAQQEFLHFLRQNLPGKEYAESQAPAELKPQPVPPRRHLYSSRRSLGGFFPWEALPVIMLITFFMLCERDLSSFHFLTAMTWCFCLMLLGATIISSRNDFIRNARLPGKSRLVPLGDLSAADRVPVKVKGRAIAGPYTLENGTLYREYIVTENGAKLSQQLMQRFKKQLSWQSVPFYLEEGGKKILVFIQDALTGIFHNPGRSISEGDILYAWGIPVKNTLAREFPDAALFLAKCPAPGESLFLLADSENKLGRTPHDETAIILELAAGWVYLSAGLAGGALLFLATQVGGQKGIDALLSLFS
ncbi:MAG: hypothetical protein RDV48_14120 [Candidatus Eremiobacteraeota bacterium]|nr:hypothetical protein [Candidatus Eremiobacteraeota bacterium]